MLCCLFAIASGCSTTTNDASDSGAPPADSSSGDTGVGADSSSETGADAHGDAGADSSADATSDAPSDTADATSDAPSDGDAPLTADVACAQWAGAWCTQMSSCTPWDLQRLYGDEATCKTRVALLCLAGVAASGSGLTADAASACATARAAQSCNDFVGGVVPAECTPSGSHAVGDACIDSVQCASGLLCSAGLDPFHYSGDDDSAATTCGKCQHTIAPGDPCSGTDAICQRGSACVGPSGSQTCQTFGGPGDDCTTALCVSYAYCDSTNHCVALLGLGDACDTGSDHCDTARGLVCDSTNHCVAIVPAAPGAECSTISANPKCTASSLCYTGSPSCVFPQKEGDPCSIEQPCMAPAACVAGACVLPDASKCP